MGGMRTWSPNWSLCEQVRKLSSVWARHPLPPSLLPNLPLPRYSRWLSSPRRMGEGESLAGLAPGRLGTGVSLPISYLIDGNRTWEGRKGEMVPGRLGSRNKGRRSHSGLPFTCQTKSHKACWPGSASTRHCGENTQSGQNPLNVFFLFSSQPLLSIKPHE